VFAGMVTSPLIELAVIVTPAVIVLAGMVTAVVIAQLEGSTHEEPRQIPAV
jgi:hypothetical protein